MTVLGNTYQKVMNRSKTQTLKSLILVPPLERECSFHFCRFVTIVITLVPKWASNWCTWVPLRPESWQKWGLENIAKNVTNKVRISAQICSKKRVPKSWFFMVFRVPIPGWSPRGPRTGSKAQKHAKMEAPSWIFCYFVTIISYILDVLLRCFEYTMKNVLIILFVKVMTLVVQPSKLSWVTYAKWAQLD